MFLYFCPNRPIAVRPVYKELVSVGWIAIANCCKYSDSAPRGTCLVFLP